LDIGPKADGSISELQLSRLRELGKWLRINGEGIYETRPWLRSDGKTQDGIPIRFTQKGDALYAILLAKPRSREISVESLRPKAGTQIQMLGANGNLSWSVSGENLKVTMPNELPGDHAYSLKIFPQSA
jgi:alpha-L-fucosidase